MLSPRSSTLLKVAAASLIGATACRPHTAAPVTTGPAPRPTPVLMPPLAALGVHRVVPMPASVVAASGAPLALSAATTIVVPAGGGEAARIGEALGALLRPATGFPFTVTSSDAAAPNGSIVLRLGGAATLSSEGYELTISADSVRIVAAAPAGLFHGIQTFRQLLPAAIEAEQSMHR